MKPWLSCRGLATLGGLHLGCSCRCHQTSGERKVSLCHQLLVRSLPCGYNTTQDP